jgi:septum formation protein
VSTQNANDSDTSGEGSLSPHPPFVLASASPRRRLLLREAGLRPVIEPADVDETQHPGEVPAEYVLRLARLKAGCVSERLPGAVVLGADTVVVLGQEVYGKPSSVAEARIFLRRLSGRTHHVLTGVCIVRGVPVHEAAWVCRTAVRFGELTDAEIDTYCGLVNTLDKAGAYAIQEHGHMIVAAIDGPRSNVIGLPTEEVLSRLAEFGLELPG